MELSMASRSSAPVSSTWEGIVTRKSRSPINRKRAVAEVTGVARVNRWATITCTGAGMNSSSNCSS